MLHQTRFTYGQRVYLMKHKPTEGIIDTVLIRQNEIKYKVKLANSCFVTVSEEDLEEIV